MKFWRERISNAAAATVVFLACTTSPDARNVMRDGDDDLTVHVGSQRTIVRACPHERLFARSDAFSPSGRWLIGRGTYAPNIRHMVSEYTFVVYVPTGTRIIDGDFGRAFKAPFPKPEMRWLPNRPATLRYTPSGGLGKSVRAPVDVPLPATAPAVPESICATL